MLYLCIFTSDTWHFYHKIFTCHWQRGSNDRSREKEGDYRQREWGVFRYIHVHVHVYKDSFCARVDQGICTRGRRRRGGGGANVWKYLTSKKLSNFHVCKLCLKGPVVLYPLITTVKLKVRWLKQLMALEGLTVKDTDLHIPWSMLSFHQRSRLISSSLMLWQNKRGKAKL